MCVHPHFLLKLFKKYASDIRPGAPAETREAKNVYVKPIKALSALTPSSSLVFLSVAVAAIMYLISPSSTNPPRQSNPSSPLSLLIHCPRRFICSRIASAICGAS